MLCKGKGSPTDTDTHIITCTHTHVLYGMLNKSLLQLFQPYLRASNCSAFNREFAEYANTHIWLVRRGVEQKGRGDLREVWRWECI